MTNPYSDDRADNPFPYYEDKPLPKAMVNWSIEKQSDIPDEEPATQEPRTPFLMSLYHSWSGKYFTLKVRRNTCELYKVDKQESVLSISRKDANIRIDVRKSLLVFHDENDKEYKLQYNTGNMAELQYARLMAWREQRFENSDPVAAYLFIHDMVVRNITHYMADKFVLLSLVVVAVQILFLLVAFAPMYDNGTQKGYALAAAFFAPVTACVLGLTAALKSGRRWAMILVVWSVLIPMTILLLLCIISPPLLFLLAILLGFPFLIVSKYYACSLQLRQLKTDNAEIFM